MKKGGQVSMKLLIDTKSKRVLFAEAGKDCVDLLFHISAVIRLIRGQYAILPNLFKSFENLDQCSMHHEPRWIKNANLKQRTPPAKHPSCSVSYIVMDDLEVKPMSTISSVTLLKKLKVKEVDSLQEKVVCLGEDETVKLLNMSIHIKNVLTEMFLRD